MDILTSREKRFAIIEAVAQRHSVNMKHMMGKCRRAPTVRARREAMTLIRAYTGDSLPKIGRLFGKDHTTVLYDIACHFGFKRYRPGRSVGMGQEATDGLALFGEQLKLEAQLYIQLAETAKRAVMARNPLYQQMQEWTNAA